NHQSSLIPDPRSLIPPPLVPHPNNQYNNPMSTPLAHGRGDYKRILAVKLADLGDLLTVTPALQALRSAYPSAQIDLLVPPSSEDLLRGAPYVDRILAFDKFPFDRKRGLLNVERLVRTASFLVSL